MSDTVNKVSINRIIGNVIGNLGLKNTNNLKDDFARWACEGESKIGSTTSYKRFECELVIRNRKAALPPNFCYLNAIKFGNQILSTTKRSFRMFNKGASNGLSNSLEQENFKTNQLITDKPGVPLSIDVIFSGLYLIGDLIAITITSNDCGKVESNTYNYLVQNNNSLTDISLQLNNQINAVRSSQKSTPSNDKFNLTGKSPEVSFTVSLFTDSVSGSISQEIIQKRVIPRKNTVDISNKNTNPILTSKNLADSNVTKLNTGINAQGNGGLVSNYSYNYDINPSDEVFSIDNGCINFNANDNERIGISYMGVDLDEDGWPLISELHEDAVTHYVMFMYKSMEYYSGKLPKHVHSTLENRWYWLCGQARGDDELPNTEEMKYLSNLWMQLIPLPEKNNF